MIELFFIIQLCKSIGRMAKAKGRSAGAYKAMLVALWFGGEITGMFIGMTFTQNTGAGYLCALIGTGLGAAISFVTISSVAPLATVDVAGPRGFPVMPPRGEYL